jgi:N-acetylmuramoyl-L-alanine amidase
MRIMLDAGHGLNTPGKRTPDDSMREFQFNSAVAEYTKELLLCYEDVTVDFAHDPSGNIDISLLARTNTANSKKVVVYVSIHGNAFGSGWGDANGIETFIHPTNNTAISRKLANLVQKKLIAATGLRDRGVKTANFHVLRETDMPSILVEGGFMTNQTEAALMKSESYRRKSSSAIASALAEFYNLKPKKVAKQVEQELTPKQEAVRQEAVRLGITDGKNPLREVNQYYVWNAMLPLAKKIEELEKKIK